MATSALKSAVVSPPWTTSRSTRVRAANDGSKWSGFRSPLILANASTSSAVKVRDHVARVPTRAGPSSSITLRQERLDDRSS